jgi:Fur family ferric uptake transcriptional regulator
VTSSRPRNALTSELRDRIAGSLGEREQRLTRNRAALVEVLAGSRSPLTIPEIVATDPSLAQSSVYRNLTVLEEIGLVRRIVTDGEHAHYELAEELTGHHHHLVCSSCGSVADIDLAPALEQGLTRAARDVARRTGFRTEHHRVDLVGICARCG